MGDYTLTVMDVPMSNDLGGFQYTLDGGLSFDLTRDTSLYAGGSWTKGDAVDNYTISGGLRFNW